MHFYFYSLLPHHQRTQVFVYFLLCMHMCVRYNILIDSPDSQSQGIRVSQLVYTQGYRPEHSGVWIWAGERDFPLQQNIQSSSRACPAFYSVHTRVLSWRQKCPQHEVDHSGPSRPRLRMSRALPLLFLYGFVAWTEKIQHLAALSGMWYQYFRGPYCLRLQTIRGQRKYPSKMLVPM